MSSDEKIEYDTAIAIAKPYFYDLLLLDRTKKAAIVGSLRRKAEMIGDIDYQLHGSPSEVRSFFREKGWLAESHGMGRQIYKYQHEHMRIGQHLYKAPKINVFFADYSCWGAALMHNTGPAKYNIRKRFLVKRKGWLLNQYGLFTPCKDDDFPDDIFEESGEMTMVAAITEKDIYEALGWTYCKPEDRK